MTDKPPRRGRRDNGLEAVEYAIAADVDPRIGEHLLDVLALAKIAAYLQPTSDFDPVTMTRVLPARPTDRLYVDRQHLQEAREYARRLESGNDPLDEAAEQGGDLDDFEVRWRDLVRQLETDRDGGNSSDLGVGDSRPEPKLAPERGGDFRLPRLRSALPGMDPDEPTLLDALDADFSDGDDRFVPPNPPPLPPISRPALVSLAAIVAGVLVLLWPNLLGYVGIHGTEGALVVAALFLVAGCVGLVLRLRPGDDEEDEDPDDGARV
ncbi:MAG TPA: DUF308 domain-containing protein [Micromonosporaceae bacterium]